MNKKIIILAAFLLVSAAALVAADLPKKDGDAWLGRPVRDPELSRVMAVVEQGWRSRLEAGLDRNRGQEARYETELGRFYSARTPRQIAAADAVARGEAAPATTTTESIMAFDPLAPSRATDQNTSELAKQKAYVSAGRANERQQAFRVLDFGVDRMVVGDHSIQGDNARVVVDITYWSLFLFDDGKTQVTAKPSNTERHTFELRREDGDWKIVSDTFEFAPGSEP
jgi:hypothetical protein